MQHKIRANFFQHQEHVGHGRHFWRLLLVAILSCSYLALSPQPARAAIDCDSVTEIPVAECQALVAFYQSTDGPNWIEQDNWLITTTPCSWYGIRCTPEDAPAGVPRHVIQIWLTSNRLSGALPAEIEKLTGLQVLGLFHNEISSLPAEFGNLSNLIELNLDINQLSSLPPEIGKLSSLQQLSLSRNQLTTLPPEFGNLSNLVYLVLSMNQLTTLPPEFGRLSSLDYLSMYTNPLTTLPAEFGQLSKLGYLDLDDNELTNLPPEIGNLTSLTSLFLGSNQLTYLPPEIGNLRELRELYLLNNKELAGPLPHTFTQLTKLYLFWFNDTQLCEPADPAFQSWLDGVLEVISTGVICASSPPPPPATTPVRVTLFTGEVAQGTVKLEWETDVEANLLGFNLYRVTAGHPATKLNSTLIAPQGNAETGAHYEFMDQPGQGEHIYLIKNVDEQGIEHLRGQVEVAAEGYFSFMPALAAP